jgi:hypothetical protein
MSRFNQAEPATFSILVFGALFKVYIFVQKAARQATKHRSTNRKNIEIIIQN